MSVQGPNSVYASIAPDFASSPRRPSAPATVPTVGAATSSVSPWAQLLGKLQRVRQTDPSTFVHIVGQMSDTVRREAQTASGSQRENLTQLADQLGQVAKTGDLSVYTASKHHRHQHPASAQPAKPPSLMTVLLEQVDHVLGPGASSPFLP